MTLSVSDTDRTREPHKSRSPGNVPEITSLRESVCRASLLPAAQTALAGSCSCCRRCRPSTARRRQRSRPLGPLWQSVTEAAAAAGDGSDKCTTYSTKNDPPGNHLRKLSPQEARTSPTKPIPPSLTLPIGRWQQLAKSNMADKAKEGCSGGESRPFNDGADGRWRCRLPPRPPQPSSLHASVCVRLSAAAAAAATDSKSDSGTRAKLCLPESERRQVQRRRRRRRALSLAL